MNEDVVSSDKIDSKDAVFVQVVDDVERVVEYMFVWQYDRYVIMTY